jgi:hypothetical protein
MSPQIGMSSAKMHAYSGRSCHAPLESSMTRNILEAEMPHTYQVAIRHNAAKTKNCQKQKNAHIPTAPPPPPHSPPNAFQATIRSTSLTLSTRFPSHTYIHTHKYMHACMQACMCMWRLQFAWSLTLNVPHLCGGSCSRAFGVQCKHTHTHAIMPVYMWPASCWPLCRGS